MQEIIHQQAPAKRTKVGRLTAKLKALPIDAKTGIRLDYDTARCLREYGNYHGWQVVQRRDGDKIIIWRIG